MSVARKSSLLKFPKWKRFRVFLVFLLCFVVYNRIPRSLWFAALAVDIPSCLKVSSLVLLCVVVLGLQARIERRVRAPDVHEYEGRWWAYLLCSALMFAVAWAGRVLEHVAVTFAIVAFWAWRWRRLGGVVFPRGHRRD